MTTVDEQGRTEPPLSGDEIGTLVGFLDYQRQTLAWKAGGLDAAGMDVRVGVSTITIGGMLKHLAYVEQHWFRRRLRGLDAEAPWDTVDWDADPDWDWHSAASDTPEQLFALWNESVSRSRTLLASALAEGDLGQLARKGWADGTPSVRWILCHMIEEYARHNGHVDLIRETIDGLTGE